MNVYVIAYEAANMGIGPGEIDCLAKGHDNWVKISDKCFALASHMEKDEVFDSLTGCLGPEDTLYVFKVGERQAGTGPVWTERWLERHLVSA